MGEEEEEEEEEMRLVVRFAERRGRTDGRRRRKTSSCHFHLNFKFFRCPSAAPSVCAVSKQEALRGRRGGWGDSRRRQSNGSLSSTY